MELEARGIIIAKSIESAEALSGALLPEIKLTDFEIRRTLLKAIQSFRETPFDICFISESFSLEELESFFSDVKALKRQDRCVFVQVRDELGEGVRRDSLADQGLATIVNSHVTDGDKAAIGDLLVELLKRHEIQKRTLDVETAIKLMMLEIDRVSSDRKRGRHREYSRNILSGFVTEQLNFHSDIMDGYFKALEHLSEKSAPSKSLMVKLPQSLIDRHLPGIVDGEYTGTSLRVWEMLREKFGSEKAEVDVVDADVKQIIPSEDEVERSPKEHESIDDDLVTGE